MSFPRPRGSRVGLLLLVVFLLLVVAACAAPAGSPGASGAATSATPTPIPTPLHPAPLGADPLSLLAWAFTPIFQVAFFILIAFYKLTGDIGIAIIALTIAIRIPLIPLFRKQTVSMRTTQLLAPEVKEIQRRNKGNRQAIFDETQAMYRSYGISQFSGCLPILLQMPLLFVMYQVIREGLTNYDVSSMLTVFGNRLIDLGCPTVPNVVNGVVVPCVNTTVAWLGGLDVGRSHIDFGVPIPFLNITLGISIIAIFSAILQVLQSRMTMPPLDPASPDQTARMTRQTMVVLPLIFVFYAGFLPAGLYIYYTASTIISIIQQYLIVGWGSLFPLFGWKPGFAANHTPRFPVALPAPTKPTRPAGAPARSTSPGKQAPDRAALDRTASAAKTVRSSGRGRQGRRGRRR
ncbi:MAG TPA: YidC/Oxa1 family membrane protein insertase [Candidatus Limnocylindrales bacterium]